MSETQGALVAAEDIDEFVRMVDHARSSFSHGDELAEDSLWAAVEFIKDRIVEGQAAEPSVVLVSQVITTDEGATYTPWTDGWALGYKVTAEGKPDRYVCLNPSGGQDTGKVEDTDIWFYLGDDTVLEEAFYATWFSIWHSVTNREGE